MNSNLAIKLYALIKNGTIKSNAMFWREFSKEKIEKFDIDIFDIEKELQEKKSLLSVDDSFKKIIIVKDIIKPYCDNDGIVTIGLFDFLQNENSLEL